VVAGIERPAVSRAEVATWSPLVGLALAVGLVPTLVLAVASTPVQALATAVTR
jgi:NADH-quinone oxidoreductase subunit M